MIDGALNKMSLMKRTASPKQQFADGQHEKGDEKQDKPQRNQRREIEIAARLGKLVGQRSRNRRSRLQDRGADAMRIADHEGDGHRLAERTAETEHDAAN